MLHSNRVRIPVKYLAWLRIHMRIQILLIHRLLIMPLKLQMWCLEMSRWSVLCWMTECLTWSQVQRVDLQYPSECHLYKYCLGIQWGRSWQCRMQGCKYSTVWSWRSSWFLMLSHHYRLVIQLKRSLLFATRSQHWNKSLTILLLHISGIHLFFKLQIRFIDFIGLCHILENLIEFFPPLFLI